MSDRIGQQLGNYQLTRLLGEGGFAEVYLGEHVHLGTQAAIKVLHAQLASDDLDKFRAEARIIAHLIHPQIVRVLEFGIEGKTPFLVMDHAPNGTLHQHHPKGVALPLPLIVAYVKQVADALQYAHDEKVIHRDVKPENMLLGRHNEILLSDFGIALVAQSSRYQSAQEMAGTMAYMSPEQIQGKPRPASDQYALGIVVYEWLTGDRPFHGSLTELVGQHLSVPPPSLRDKVSTISPEVDRIVLTALAKDPKQRFDTIQTFADVLHDAMQFPPSTGTVSPTIRARVTAPPTPLRPVSSLASSSQPEALVGDPTGTKFTRVEPNISKWSDSPPTRMSVATEATSAKGKSAGTSEAKDARKARKTGWNASGTHHYKQHIFSTFLLILSLMLCVSITVFQTAPILSDINRLFLLFFGWSAYLLALGLVVSALAGLLGGIRGQQFVRLSLVAGLICIWLLLLIESALIMGSENVGILGALLVLPFLGWSRSVDQVVVLGVLLITIIVTFRLRFEHVLLIPRYLKRLFADPTS